MTARKRRAPKASAGKTLPIAVDTTVVDAFVFRELRALSPRARDNLAALVRVLPAARLRELTPYLDAINGGGS